MKSRRRAAQLLSKMLNTQRDKCDAGEKKENKRGGGEEKKSITRLFLCDCWRQRGTVRFFTRRPPPPFSLRMSLMIRPLAPRVSSAVSLRLPRPL